MPNSRKYWRWESRETDSSLLNSQQGSSSYVGEGVQVKWSGFNGINQYDDLFFALSPLYISYPRHTTRLDLLKLDVLEPATVLIQLETNPQRVIFPLPPRVEAIEDLSRTVSQAYKGNFCLCLKWRKRQFNIQCRPIIWLHTPHQVNRYIPLPFRPSVLKEGEDNK